MWNMVLTLLQNHPKFKSTIEQLFGQPVDHVTGCFSGFMENVKKGPGLINTEQQKIAVFNRIYQGGLALGFSDWESELAAARIAGYLDVEICMSFRNRHKWPNTTVENIQSLAEHVMPRFIEKAKSAGLLPPEMFPETGIPQTNITTSGGAAPWENLTRSGAGGDGENNNAPK